MIKIDLIKRKASLIQDDLGKLTSLAHFSLQEIVSDFLRQAALERLLERIISRAIDINEHIIAEILIYSSHHLKIIERPLFICLISAYTPRSSLLK